MIARKTELHHPQGAIIETPILVPSFSSKGFGFGNKGTSGDSEVQDICNVAAMFLTETMLISAFDIYSEQLNIPKSSITELTFVDSGGYEISSFHDLSAVNRQPLKTQDWSYENLLSVYSSWPEHIPAVFVSYDHPKFREPLHQQIERARETFHKFPKQLSNFLIKPESTEDVNLPIDKIISECGNFRDFDIIGVTEKELGNSIITRMANIAAIRIALDDKHIRTPLHIFGSLDPITSVLYFLSGAEIFDGLTWLRYGYSAGHACYWNNYGAESIGIHRTDDFIRGKTIQENLGYLLDLTSQMKKFLLDYDFKKFAHNADFFKNNYDLLRTKNKRVI